MMLERPRRNRKSNAIRNLVRETRLHTNDLIYPLFIEDGKGIKNEIASLPGNFMWSQDTVLEEIDICLAIGLDSFILFPKINDVLKDKEGTYGYSPENFYLEVAHNIKRKFPDCTLISDVALDPYSCDGHDGIVTNGIVDNDLTLDLLSQMAILQAEAGFDILGPSDMMDGRIGNMREALDDAGYTRTSLMSYSAKYASAYYGPFRDALESAPVNSPNIPRDKKTYQMDPANRGEALREADLDVIEGADFLMVKPALHYLDVIQTFKENYNLPIAAYHVSGECAMLIAACEKGWLNFETAMPEVLLSIKRAGADAILTYFAKAFAQLQP